MANVAAGGAGRQVQVLEHQRRGFVEMAVPRHQETACPVGRRVKLGLRASCVQLADQLLQRAARAADLHQNGPHMRRRRMFGAVRPRALPIDHDRSPVGLWHLDVVENVAPGRRVPDHLG